MPPNQTVPPMTEPNTSNSSNPQGNMQGSVPTPPTNQTAQPNKLIKPKLTFYTKWYFWTIIVLVMVCAFSLGIMGYYIHQNFAIQDQIKELENTILEKDQQIAKYAALIGQKVEDSSRPGYIDEENIDTKKFVYISEWGLKFKIPSGLKDVSYKFIISEVEPTEESSSTQQQSVCVTGVPIGTTYIPEYAKDGINSSMLGCLTRYDKKRTTTIPGMDTQTDYQDSNYYYQYQHPQAMYSKTEEERKLELTAVNLVQELLTKNISQIVK